MRALRLRLVLVLSMVVIGCLPIAGQVPAIGNDLVITRSITFPKSDETIRIADDGAPGVVVIRGEDIVVDFGGRRLSGRIQRSLTPDNLTGIGILVDGGKNVTLQNLRVDGYKLGVLARSSPGLVIEDCDVSDNYKQRLKSTFEAEDATDWLYGHENDADEWQRYGAGIYLDDCDDFTVRHCRGNRGQNGVCITESNHGFVHDNDFSFNSGWGIALYRSSRNQVAHNKADWCIRGYSHGIYHRGQDSAGILVYEQCSRNVFAFNSATHGGDGFFLYSGNETLNETGVGGCDDNLVYGNDFSHASNNGIEATFSSGNIFAANIMDQADHGIWAGYSRRCKFLGNRITRCNHGLSVEHGHDNVIVGNVFSDNKVAINLWWDDDKDLLATIFAKKNSCESTRYVVKGNEITGGATGIHLRRTTDVQVLDNRLGGDVGLRAQDESTVTTFTGNNLTGGFRVDDSSGVNMGTNHWREVLQGVVTTEKPIAITRPRFDKLAPVVRGKGPAMLARDAPRGLRYMIVDEWGPVDFKVPRVMPPLRRIDTEKVVRIIGPGGTFTTDVVSGPIEITPTSGAIPGLFRVKATKPGVHVFRFAVGIEGRGRLFGQGVVTAFEWDVKFFDWPRVGVKKPPRDWAGIVSKKPIAMLKTKRLNFRSGGAFADGVPADHFATVATATFDARAGRYELDVTSDDGVRVFVDDKIVLEDWTWHAPKTDSVAVTLTKGRHTIRVEHFEIDGFAQLDVVIRPPSR